MSERVLCGYANSTDTRWRDELFGGVLYWSNRKESDRRRPWLLETVLVAGGVQTGGGRTVRHPGGAYLIKPRDRVSETPQNKSCLISSGCGRGRDSASSSSSSRSINRTASLTPIVCVVSQSARRPYFTAHWPARLGFLFQQPLQPPSSTSNHVYVLPIQLQQSNNNRLHLSSTTETH